MRPAGLWGRKEFAQFTEDELHETMMEAEPGSHYFEWAKAELDHRQRLRTMPSSSDETRKAENEAVKNSGNNSQRDSLSAPLMHLHQAIREKCSALYASGHHAEAVEKGFKVVRDRLRSLTGYEKGAEAFGKGRLHISGASAANVEHDFNEAVKFLLMAVDYFRNEKAHTADAKITDPTRAEHYLTLSSLAMYLLDEAEGRKMP